MSNSTISSTSSIESTSSLPISTSSSIESTSIPPSTSSSIESSTSIPPSSTTTFTPTSTTPSSTTTVSLSTQPATTRVFTSVVTTGPTSDGATQSAVTVVVTQTQDGTTQSITPTASSSDASSTTSGSPALNTDGSKQKSGGGGLSTAGTTAVAVVVPVVVVALLVLAGIFFWRKRKQKKAAEEARRKEVEDYGFNPNNDPTLPTVASESGQEMSEDHSSGYRGWGAAGAASNRKMSTTLSGGHTQGQLSDTGSNPYRGGASPTGAASDGHSGDALMHQRRETMNSDDVGSLGQAPLASANQPGMKRGPSNASSTYSAAGHSDVSDGAPPPPGGMASSYEAYNANNGFGYSQHGPYGDGTYGGAAPESGMPVVRDVSARRNTRIQQPGNYQQGNSGIAQNF